MIMSNKFNKFYKRVISEQNIPFRDGTQYNVDMPIIIPQLQELLVAVSRTERFLFEFLMSRYDNTIGLYVGCDYPEFKGRISSFEFKNLFKQCKNKELTARYLDIEQKKMSDNGISIKFDHYGPYMDLVFTDRSQLDENQNLIVSVTDWPQIGIQGFNMNLGKPKNIQHNTKWNYVLITLKQNQIDILQQGIKNWLKKMYDNIKMNGSDEICSAILQKINY